MTTQPAGPRGWLVMFGRRKRYGIALTLALVLGATILGGASAASRSLPGQLLYPFKRRLEAIQLFITPPADRAAAHLALAQVRLGEMYILYGQGRVSLDVLDTLTLEIQAEDGMALDYAESLPGQRLQLLGSILQGLEYQSDVLTVIRSEASEAERYFLDRAAAVVKMSRYRAAQLAAAQLASSNGAGAPSAPSSTPSSPTATGEGRLAAPVLSPSATSPAPTVLATPAPTRSVALADKASPRLRARRLRAGPPKAAVTPQRSLIRTTPLPPATPTPTWTATQPPAALPTATFTPLPPTAEPPSQQPPTAITPIIEPPTPAPTLPSPTETVSVPTPTSPPPPTETVQVPTPTSPPPTLPPPTETVQVPTPTSPPPTATTAPEPTHEPKPTKPPKP